MTPRGHTEDTLVQKTTVDDMEQKLGWESVYAYNNEDFGPASLLGHLSDRKVVLTRALREALKRLNPDLPDAVYDDAVRQITETVGLPPRTKSSPSDSLGAGSRRILAL